MNGVKRRKPKPKPFAEEQYIDLLLTDLVLYSLFSLTTKGVEGTFENLVAESYELFPKKFSLPGYPEYPDSRRVEREIRRMSGGLPSEGSSGLVKGNLKTNFNLTENGLNKLTEIQQKLKTDVRDEKAIKKMKSDKRGKIGRIIDQVQNHMLYKEYLQKENKTDIPEHLLRDLLFATMETSKENLREKMKILMDYCDDSGRNDIKEFLMFCRMKNPRIFLEDPVSEKENV